MTAEKDVLHWTETRTGNVLLKRSLFDGKDNMFRPEFASGGEDRDFFRRMIDQGHSFIWCADAPVFERVPPERFTRSFMIKRALLRGKIPYNQNIKSYVKSLLAIPLYAFSLPLLFCMGHHVFMKYLIKCFDHAGRLLALLRFTPVKEKYVLK